MLGFHRRTRSLIPVKDLAKYDVVPAEDQYEEEEKELFADDQDQILDDEAAQGATKSRQRQLLLVYIVVFAEA
jgi:hypothetical protein